MQTVTIYKDDYINLLVRDEILTRLETGGVSNWTGFYESLNPKNDISLEEFEADLKYQLRNAHNKAVIHK